MKENISSQKIMDWAKEDAKSFIVHGGVYDLMVENLFSQKGMDRIVEGLIVHGGVYDPMEENLFSQTSSQKSMGGGGHRR